MAKSNYITRQGWQMLDQELKYLWKEESGYGFLSSSFLRVRGTCFLE